MRLRFSELPWTMTTGRRKSGPESAAAGQSAQQTGAQTFKKRIFGWGGEAAIDPVELGAKQIGSFTASVTLQHKVAG
jgi:hypothetical protein